MLKAAAAVTISGELTRLAALCAGDRVTLRRLIHGMSARDHALLTLFISVCFLHPIPMPGLSSLLGLTIVAAGWRMACRLGPWVPARFIDRELPGALLRKIFTTAGSVIRRCEGLIRPRIPELAEHRWIARANGAVIAGCGLLILIPLPPPTNFPPAIALLLLSIGVLRSDALFLAFGYAAFALNLLIFGAIFAFGWDGVQALLR